MKMKIKVLGMVGASFLWSGVAAADAFPTCTDAANYGYNMVRNFVSASYNKAQCNRDTASQYEHFLVQILPAYLPSIARTTTPEKDVCLLQGCYEAWLDTTADEYSDCSGVPGFEAIQRSLLGLISGNLFQPFYFLAPSSYPAATIPTIFAYPYDTLPLSGTSDECEAQLRGALSGVPQDVKTALVVTVCSK